MIRWQPRKSTFLREYALELIGVAIFAAIIGMRLLAHHTAHRAHIVATLGPIKVAMVGHGCPQEAATAILKSIAKGEIPNISIQF